MLLCTPSHYTVPVAMQRACYCRSACFAFLLHTHRDAASVHCGTSAHKDYNSHTAGVVEDTKEREDTPAFARNTALAEYIPGFAHGRVNIGVCNSSLFTRRRCQSLCTSSPIRGFRRHRHLLRVKTAENASSYTVCDSYCLCRSRVPNVLCRTPCTACALLVL